jgi:3-oxoacyl-[acyl-carrier protein] reductase
MPNERVALVTGGGRGIGAAAAKRLAADGFTVAVNYVGAQSAAEATRDTIVAAGGKAALYQADITDLAANKRLFDQVIADLGRLDVLVNSAGIGASMPFGEMDEAGYDKVFAIAKGIYFAMKNAAEVMANDGRIINLSSGKTRNWAVNTAAYAGSKAAVEQFTRSLSKEVGVRGITVNAVLPGLVVTDMMSFLPDSHLENARQQTSFGRLGQVDDIADVVGFLASEQSRWITGQLIVANGGSTP